MKKIITLISLFIYFSNGFAQVCTSDPLAGSHLFNPDSTTGIAEAYTGVAYSDVISIVVPTDTTVDLPPVGLVNLTINYLKIDSVKIIIADTIELSTIGFSYVCNPSNNQISGGNSGCLVLQCNNPLQQNVGEYPLIIYSSINVTHPLLGTWNSVQPVNDDYRIVINGNGGILTADFVPSATTIYAGSSVTFTNSSSNATSYSWSFPGGNPSTSTQTNPIVTYANTGNYTATLTASDGINFESYSVVITVIDLPVQPCIVRCMAISGSNIFVGTSEYGVFLSSNNGATWTEVNNGLTVNSITSLAVSGNYIYAGTVNNSGLYVSSNNGSSWTLANNGLPNCAILSLAASGPNVYAGTYAGVYVTSNNGFSWASQNNGLPSNGLNVYARSIAISGSTMFLGTDAHGIYYSSNGGVNWTSASTGLPTVAWYSLAISGSNVFAGNTSGNIYLSGNNGGSWTSVSNGLSYNTVRSIAISGSDIFAGTWGGVTGGVYHSNNNGSSWSAVNNGLTNTAVYTLKINGSNIFAGTEDGVFLSSNNGGNWQNTARPTPIIGGNAWICPGESQVLSVTNPCSGCTYNWSNGMTGQNVAISTQGTYRVSATNNCGTSPLSNIFNTYMYSVTTPWINVLTPSVNGSAVTLQANYGNPGDVAGYLWSDGSTNQTLTTSIPGDYSVQIITIQSGCTSPASQSVTLASTPVIIDDHAFCYGQPTTLTVTNPCSGCTYNWSNGMTGQSVIINSEGTYYVTASSNCGTSAPSNNIVLKTVYTPSISTVTSSCNGSAATMIANYTDQSDVAGYLWSDGSTSQSITTSVLTDYFVQIITNEGCTSPPSLEIALPTISVFEPTISVVNYSCNGSPATLMANYTNPWEVTGYLWSNGATTQNISTSVSGNYTVEVVTNQNCPPPPSQPMALPIISNCGGNIVLESESGINYFDTLDVTVSIGEADNLFSVFGKLNFDDNAMRLVQSAEAGYLGTNIISTPPVVTGGVIDFGVTKTSGQAGTSGDGLFYTFRFVLTNLPTSVPFNANSPDSMFTRFTLTNLTVNDATGAQRVVGLPQPDTTWLRYYVPVWPGDLNNDYHVNVADILPIGYFYNSTGPVRPNASLTWVAQPAPLWAFDKTNHNSPAYKTFADGNGSGLIDLADQNSIGFNLSHSHALQIPTNMLRLKSSNAPELSVNIAPTTIDSTQLPLTVPIPINVGSSSNPISNLYGLAFDLLFDQTYVDTANIQLDYSNTIFGNLNADYIKIEDLHPGSGRLSIGMTRYNTTELNNYGEVLTVNMPIRADVTTGWFKFRAVPLASNDITGLELEVNDGIDSVYIITPISNSIAQIDEAEKIIIYPNPTNGSITIEGLTEKANATIMDAAGRVVLAAEIINNKVDVSALANGVYMLRIETANGLSNFRIIKQ